MFSNRTLELGLQVRPPLSDADSRFIEVLSMQKWTQSQVCNQQQPGLAALLKEDLRFVNCCSQVRNDPQSSEASSIPSVPFSPKLFNL